MFEYFLFLMVVMVHFVTNYAIANTEIDQRHLKLYPFCGRFPNSDDVFASSRVVNSRDSDKTYPWVVGITRRNINKNMQMEMSTCSGSVITSRYKKRNLS